MTAQTLAQELDELGLALPKCGHFMNHKNRMCSQPAVVGSDKCIYHGGVDLALADDVRTYRQQLQKVGIPVAIQRLLDILEDPEARDENVIKAAFGIMDRCGLGPVAGLQVEGHIETSTPLEALTALLAGVRERLTGGEVVDAEVVEP